MRCPAPDSRSGWDDVAHAWLGDRPRQLWREHADAINADLLSRWLPSAYETVLKTDLFDEAVGEGQIALLGAGAAEVHGIDISPVIVAAARSRSPGLQGVVGDVRRLPYPDQSFDVAVSLSTLDHFVHRDEIDQGLRELFRMLRPGGTLIITLDNQLNPVVALRNALPTRLLVRLGLVPYYCGPSLRPRGLLCALDRCGFAVCRSTVIMHCPRVAAVALASWLDRSAGTRAHDAFRRSMRWFERLEATPLRPVTGYFTAVRCIRPEPGARTGS